MKKMIACTFLFVTFLSCTGKVRDSLFAEENKPCPENINLLPMYGRAEKCKEQLESDRKFLKSCDQQYSSRTEAATAYVEWAWLYFRNFESGVAMERLNQAWLLDSLNADVYWGFGVLLGNQNELLESVSYLKKSAELNPNNPSVWIWLALNYRDLYGETSIEKYKDQIEPCLQKAIELNPETDYRALLEKTEEKIIGDNEDVFELDGMSIVE